MLIDTKVLGTLPEGMVGLIIGRSSNINIGLEVIPGVLDSDTKSTIKVVAKSNKDALIIRKGQRIAQVLLLPYCRTPNPILLSQREGQFGSSDVVAWTQEVTMKTASSLVGLGLAANVAKSSGMIPWSTENKSGYIQPYVIPSLPFSLWGRDLMQDLKVVITTDPLTDQYFS